MNSKSGSANNVAPEEGFQAKDMLRLRRVEMTVATSAFGSILTVAFVCGCFYFACGRHNRKSRREFWQRKGSTNLTCPSNMLITPYPTNPDLGIQDGRHVINMNYTGSAPQAPSMIYSCDPVTPSYQQNNNRCMSYGDLSLSNDNAHLFEDGDKVQLILSKAAKIKEKLKISQPSPKNHNLD